MHPAVDIRHLSKRFSRNVVLNDVSLAIEAGEVHGLLGENGSGKSTLIKVLSGFHLPEPGTEVFVEGEPLPFGSASASNAAGLRFVHQNLGLVGELNAVENIALGDGFLRPYWIGWREQRRYARDALEAVGVDVDLDTPVRQLRAVERSAIAIARAVRPKDPEGRYRRNGPQAGVRLLVLDEPTAALPPAEVDALFAIIREACARGIAVLYVSHRLDEISEITHRASILRDGKLVDTVRVQDLDRRGLVGLIVGHEVEPAHAVASVRPEADDHRGARPALRIANLTSGRLSDVSMDVQAGEIVGVAGIDGSGREDLARAVVGARAMSGTISTKSRALSNISPRRAASAGIALVTGTTHPGSSITQFCARENLTLASLRRFTRFGLINWSREKQNTEKWIKELDVRPPEPEVAFHELSGGNRQKILLGKWLSADCNVFVLDEPTAGVDVGARRSIYDLIIDQAAAGNAFLVCSSDLEDLESICDRVLVIRKGRITTELTRAGKGIRYADILAEIS
jgi:ribose transport system ATP-binding protein